MKNLFRGTLFSGRGVQILCKLHNFCDYGDIVFVHIVQTFFEIKKSLEKVLRPMLLFIQGKGIIATVSVRTCNPTNTDNH